MRLLENRRNRIRRSDQHDRFGVRGPHRVDCPSHLGCLPRIPGRRDWLSTMRFQRCFHSFEEGSAKGIFGINHADFLVPQRAPQALHLLARFVKVRSAHVHDPVAQRNVQSLRAGEQANQGYLIAFR
jgi:hypothetical protein